MDDHFYSDSRKKSWEAVLFQAAYDISIAPSLYETINARYATLEGILNGADDPVLKSAHIFPQGSIRLKTAIKPLQGATGDLGTVDADAVVWLENASTTSADYVLQAIQQRFQDGKRVTADIEELRRGIRIKYADENPGFHIDVTPARNLRGNTAECGNGALEVPDRKQGWKASSPIEYSDWLNNISEKTLPVMAMDSFRESTEVLAKATVEKMPGYGEYVDPNVLRALIKLIKRTRDVWAVKNPSRKDFRPISAVLTTLAGLAYEKLANNPTYIVINSPFEVMKAVIDTMPEFIKGSAGRWEVLNPVNSNENFAEKWNREGGENYRVAFNDWYSDAVTAFSLGMEEFSSNASFQDALNESFGIGQSTVDKTMRYLPQDWNLPGRELGKTGATVALAAMSGQAVASSRPQSVQHSGRLG
jgi:hypothetical protein